MSAKSSRSNQPRSILFEAKERLLRFRRCAFDRVRVIVSFAGCRRTKTPCLTLISRVARAKRQRGTWARQKLFRLCNRQPVYIFARVRSQGTSLRRNVATFCRIYRTRRHVGTKNVTRTGECSVNIDKFYVVQHAACSRTNGGAASCFRRRVLEMRVQPPSEPREKEEERERERESSHEKERIISLETARFPGDFSRQLFDSRQRYLRETKNVLLLGTSERNVADSDGIFPTERPSCIYIDCTYRIWKCGKFRFVGKI